MFHHVILIEQKITGVLVYIEWYKSKEYRMSRHTFCSRKDENAMIYGFIVTDNCFNDILFK